MDAISLFCGAGGIDFGAQRAGAKVVFANDVLPESEAIFARWFPAARFELGSVELVKRFPQADLVLAGYPCQSFSLGGARKPEADPRTNLYLEFARCLDETSPRFFLAENVPGLRGLDARRWLWRQHDRFSMAGRRGYNVTTAVVKAEEHGVPQRRRRVFFVGVRRDLRRWYHFPEPSCRSTKASPKHLLPPPAHGDWVSHLPLWPDGEFYQREEEVAGQWPWYYMSRNRKAPWDGPAFTVIANARHVTLHPASPKMEMIWSDLSDGWKQAWRFANDWDHLAANPKRPVLERPRRLSWRECAALQTFPPDFVPPGSLKRKYELVGNAVPPLLAHTLLEPLIDGTALHRQKPRDLERLFQPSKAWSNPPDPHDVGARRGSSDVAG